MPDVARLAPAHTQLLHDEVKPSAEVATSGTVRGSDFQSCAHAMSFLTGFAQRAASHAERGNLRQRIHSFFMMRLSQAQSCRSCHLRHSAQQRFPVVRAYYVVSHRFCAARCVACRAWQLAPVRTQLLHDEDKPSAKFSKLPPLAQGAAAISSRARMLVVSHRFCAARCVACRAWQLAPAHTQLLHDEDKPSAEVASEVAITSGTSGTVRSSDSQSCAHACRFSQVLRSALRRMPSVATCASAYTASS